jgi:hypothetical protein
MKSFVQRHQKSVTGILSGFDRLILAGSLRRIAYVDGMLFFLSRVGVLLKSFGAYIEQISDRVKAASQAHAEATERPNVYLASPKASKEQKARELLDQHPVDEGLICILRCVEPCNAYAIRRNRAKKILELVMQKRQCMHLYHYYLHPVFGFMHARLQTWAPFGIRIALNGREWLAHQMDRAGLGYVRKENCFTWLEDVEEAQRLADAQRRASWKKILDEIARTINPHFETWFPDFPLEHYWTAYQSEWATDVMFKDAPTLAKLYPTLLQHAIRTFDSPSVLRFLGKRVPAHGGVHGKFKGEVTTDLKRRPEGVRVKHAVRANSLKLYDKQGSVLRTETTINNPQEFKAYRRSEGDPDGPLDWRPVRKGIADLHRRAELSQKVNERYLEALASVSEPTPLHELARPICRPTKWKGRRVRALRPWSEEDGDLLAVISRGEYVVNGFRNRDLCRALFPKTCASKRRQRRRAGKVTRLLRLLRAHRLIRKVPKSHRYMLTRKGRTIVTALLTARQADVVALTKIAA